MVITAGSFDLLVEAVCESDDHLLELISQKIRTVPGWCPPRRSCTSSSRSRPTPGASADAVPGDAWRAPLAARSGTRHPSCRWTPRPALPGDRAADVAVVGGGYTGLWTAYYLAAGGPVPADRRAGGRGGRLRRLRAQRRLVLRAVPGDAGPARAALAAGRPARWPSTTRCARPSTRWVAVAAAEQIACDYAKGGTVVLARSAQPAAPARRRRSTDARAWGAATTSSPCSTPAEARARAGAEGTLGATYTPDCAAVHPARLVRGLAEAVERLGVTIHERTRVLRDRARTGRHRPRRGPRRGACCARRRATPRRWRGSAAPWRRSTRWSSRPSRCPRRPGSRSACASARRSPTIATSSSTASAPPTTGWSSAAAGAPYHFGSRTAPGLRPRRARARGLRRTLADLFPAVAGARFTHAWGGALGIARDWMASVGLDRRTGLGWAGGYVGDGVGTTQPRRPHAARPRARARHGADPSCPGSGTGPALGARAAAVAGRQRRAAGDDARRRRGAAHRRGPAGSRGRWRRCSDTEGPWGKAVAGTTGRPATMGAGTAGCPEERRRHDDRCPVACHRASTSLSHSRSTRDDLASRAEPSSPARAPLLTPFGTRPVVRLRLQGVRRPRRARPALVDLAPGRATLPRPRAPPGLGGDLPGRRRHRARHPQDRQGGRRLPARARRPAPPGRRRGDGGEALPVAEHRTFHRRPPTPRAARRSGPATSGPSSARAPGAGPWPPASGPCPSGRR